jgi:hypothetical protein
MHLVPQQQLETVRLTMTLRFKLIALLLAFALVPTTLIGVSLWRATQQQETQILGIYQIFAQNLADAIDRNLFERYGDVQAFGLNAAVDNYQTDPRRVVQAMNGYVEKYGLYPLMMFVDTEGVIRAVNTLDAGGAPINSRSLIGDSVTGEDWYERVRRGDYTTRQPFTAPGNDISDGTTIIDLYID